MLMLMHFLCPPSVHSLLRRTIGPSGPHAEMFTDILRPVHIWVFRKPTSVPAKNALVCFSLLRTEVMTSDHVISSRPNRLKKLLFVSILPRTFFSANWISRDHVIWRNKQELSRSVLKSAVDGFPACLVYMHTYLMLLLYTYFAYNSEKKKLKVRTEKALSSVIMNMPHNTVCEIDYSRTFSKANECG